MDSVLTWGGEETDAVNVLNEIVMTVLHRILDIRSRGKQ